MFGRQDYIREEVKKLSGTVNRIDYALRWPTLAGEEGYPHIEELAQREAGYQRGCSCEQDLQLLLEHLGLEIEEGKRIIKKGRRK